MPERRMWRRWVMGPSVVALLLAAMAPTGCGGENASPEIEGHAGKTPMIGTETCARSVDSERARRRVLRVDR